MEMYITNIRFQQAPLKGRRRLSLYVYIDSKCHEFSDYYENFLSEDDLRESLLVAMGKTLLDLLGNPVDSEEIHEGVNVLLPSGKGTVISIHGIIATCQDQRGHQIEAFLSDLRRDYGE
jgi:hypothetical protein